MTAITQEPVTAETTASPAERPARRSRRWIGTAAGAVLLAVVAFLQRPGQSTFDTKLDLAVDPIGFMGRALHLWNSEATSGELQNQAYGYLFPMGPFFAGGDLLGVPTWITQRLWSALLLVVAYLGVLLLARAIRIGSEPARLLAALAYALAPRMLTEVGPLSAEMLPVVMLPWVLLPLVTVRSPRRAAALSALAVLCMGGINAAAVLMALVLPGIWFLTRRWDRRHTALAAWWTLCVAAVSLWWALPLLLLGQYSLPFLDFIESSATTTAVTSLFQAMRGTNQWVGYVIQGEPWWPAGWVLIDSPVLMVATALVAIVGLVGLGLRGLPERRFLVFGMLTGLTLLAVGYLGTFDSPFAGPVRDLLDGPLAPLRNVHKFEPVLRLPIVLGLAHAASRAFAVRRFRLPVAPVVAAVLIVAAAPAWSGALRPGPGWSDVPDYWRQASGWLAAQDSRARTLVVPGVGFAQNAWGRTVDEVIQPLAGAPWATRNQIPLGSEGNTRVMDTVEAVLEQGRGSPALADFLARSGYRFLLVRHDIDRTATAAPPIAAIRQAVANSPGLRPAAQFGPTVAADPAGSPADAGTAVPSIEIFEVERDVPVASAVSSGDVRVVSGGPESLLTALEQGVLAEGTPAVLAGDDLTTDEPAEATPVVTDGLRRRELNVGRVRDNLSQTMTSDEETRQGRQRGDLLPFPAAGHETLAAYQGIRSVTASSSAAFADTLAPTDVSHLPFAALDGDSRTAWRSDPLAPAAGQWLEVTFDTPRRVDQLTVDFDTDLRDATPVGYVRVSTDQGDIERQVSQRPGPQRLDPLPGLTTTVRVTVLGLAPGFPNGAVALRELGIPGLAAERALRVPADAPAGSPPIYAFARGLEDRAACFAPAGTVHCDQFLRRTGEEPLGLDRIFTTPTKADYGLRLTAHPRPGGTLPLDAPVTAAASSVLAGDALVGADAAVDGDPATAWLAEPVDPAPSVDLAWTGKRRVDRLRLVVPEAPVASTPLAVIVRAAGRDLPADIGADGWVRFPAVTTDRLSIVVSRSAEVTGDARGNGWPAPVGFAEVEIPGVTARGALPAVDAPCGAGPTVTLDGTAYKTSVAGSLADVRAGRGLPVTICDVFASESVTLEAGEHRLHTTPSTAFLLDTATLTPVGLPAATPAATRAVTVTRWDSTVRTLTVAPGAAALLVIPENFSDGSAATLDGARLHKVRVDGWQQAYEVPAGQGGTVTLEFTPDRSYRAGLATGAGAVLLVVLLALVPVRRRAFASGVVAARPPTWWIVVPLGAVAVVLGGFPAVALLIAAMIGRQLWPRLLPVVAAAAALLGTGIAVVGRMQGHGQDWAYVGATQAALLAAVCAVAATLVPSAKEPPAGPPPYRATLGRAVRLFRAFLHEQSDPDRFYSTLARDSVRQLGSYVDLRDAVVLDVGGGPGYFAEAFHGAGATYLGLDPEAGDLPAPGNGGAGAPSVRGSGTALPVRTSSVDVCYSSNVVEHVSTPERMLDELVRVTRPGGTLFVSFTPWLSPWGGHETAPWHYLGGSRARARYAKKFGRQPKNRFGETLFPVSAAQVHRWAKAAARQGQVEIVDVLPRYHPWWAQWSARVPLLRETITWNYTLVLRRPKSWGSRTDVTE
ncbi:arabinofuranan 3-O-arabinosyltransferase [Asanoa hainanensis]|uniref:Arabinofuranan 3-O-arabinosyltransferase n=1 Tax=Asanoa hainanensis TaxID=560556 RepID=A0A239PA92_9ACTN|nr:alpha-(1->3)-arabinofuranosyltransferase family protein [Asanoa hainanensis]SNT63961.1 arabinofuranan 3-O-arabinosyltransferase [Asanoa hainanensis]